MTLNDITPWLDRAGRLSWLKFAAFALALLPGLYLGWAFVADQLGTKPITALIHETGLWAVRFLAVTLAISPFRRIFHFSRLILIRRQMGLTVLAYTLIHLAIYIYDQGTDILLVLSEIVHRFYLGLGFIGLVILIVMGATSTDGAIKRLGSARWNQIHSLIFPALFVTLLHFLLQSKLDVGEACLMLGLFLILIGYRFAQKREIALTFIPLIVVAFAAGVLTMVLEALWYASGGRISFWAVIESNLDPFSIFRPYWWVWLSGMAVAVLSTLTAKIRSPTAQKSHAPHRA